MGLPYGAPPLPYYRDQIDSALLGDPPGAALVARGIAPAGIAPRVNARGIGRARDNARVNVRGIARGPMGERVGDRVGRAPLACPTQFLGPPR